MNLLKKNVLKKIGDEAMPFALGIPAFLWQILFFYIPLLLVFILSFPTFSWEYFTPFFASEYVSVIVRTVLIALSTAFFCLCIAYPIVYLIVFKGGRFKHMFFLFLLLPFLTTFLLHIYAWMFVLERGGVINVLLQSVGLISEPLHLLNSSFAVIFVMVYCYLPFMILPLYSSLEKFDKRFFEASYDLGATWWQTLWRVLIPLSFPGIRSGFFLVLVPAFGEFAIPELVGGDKKMFVGSIITHYTMGAQTASLGAAFTLLTAFILLIVVVAVYGITVKIFKQ